MEENERRPWKMARRDVITCEEMEAGSSVVMGQPVAGNTGMGSAHQKHSIFLSHSGAQKAFVRRVRNALERNAYRPFFDEDPDCLPKGEPFAQRIIDASRLADVAVVVLSNKFLTSKWPMIELAIFVEEQKRRESLRDCQELKILPLFMGFSVKEFRNIQRRTNWKNKWNEMRVRDDRIDVSKWEEALKVLGGTNGLEYCGYRNEEEYIDSIMSAIFMLVTPDLRWEDTHMQGKLKFHQAVAEMFARSPSKTRFYNVRAIGLYGVGGIGKTTICKSLCNEYHARFNGKVWHAELGKKSAEEIQKDVLRRLVGTPETFFSQPVNGKGQWRSLLQKKIEFKVFLAIDNVWNEDVSREQAEALLEMGYHPDSLVIVTSRSRELLEWLGIHEECCFEMPVLGKSDAREVLLQSAAPGIDIGCLEDYQRTAVETVVERCFMTKGPISSAGSDKQYVPLALKVLGRQLRLPLLQDNPEKLMEWLGELDLKWPDQMKHPIFSVLRLSYDNLPSSMHKSIFIDVALCVPRQHDNTSASVTAVCKWLSMVHCERFDSILKILKDLERDGVVEMWHDMSSPFGMHELYCEFAKTEVGEPDDLDRQRYLYHEDDYDMPALMRQVPLQNYFPLRRIHIYGGGFRELSNEELQYMVNVEVLKLEFCSELESLDIRRLKRLRSVELRGCFSLEMVEGLEHLKYLKFFRWNSCRKSIVAADFPSALEVVEIYGSKGSEVVDIGCLGGCIGLVELTLSSHPMLAAVPDLCNLLKLERVDLSGCCKVEEVQGLGGLRRLRHLNLENCKRLRHCDGLEELAKLEALNLGGCVHVEVPQVWDLSRLVMLRSINIGGILVVRKLVLGSPHLEQLEVTGCRDLRIVALCNDSGSWRFLNRLNEQRMGEGVESLQWAVECVGPVEWNLFDGYEAVNLSNCRTLESLGQIGLLTSLKYLYLQNCSMLRTLPNLSGSPDLQVVDLSCCCMLEELGDIGPMRALQYLYLQNCGSLKSVCELESPYLKVLELSGCSRLEELGKFDCLSSLRTLNLKECLSLRGIPNLRSCLVLEVLNVKGCIKLSALPQMTTPKVVIDISECWGLESIPILNDLSKLELDVSVGDVDGEGVKYVAVSGDVRGLVLTCQRDRLAYGSSGEVETQEQSVVDMVRLKDVKKEKHLEIIIEELGSVETIFSNRVFRKFLEILLCAEEWKEGMAGAMAMLGSTDSCTRKQGIEDIIQLLKSEFGEAQAHGRWKVCGYEDVKKLVLEVTILIEEVPNLGKRFRKRREALRKRREELRKQGDKLLKRKEDVVKLSEVVSIMFIELLQGIVEMLESEGTKREILKFMHSTCAHVESLSRNVVLDNEKFTRMSLERMEMFLPDNFRSRNPAIMRMSRFKEFEIWKPKSERWEQFMEVMLTSDFFRRWEYSVTNKFRENKSERFWKQGFLEMRRFEKLEIWKHGFLEMLRFEKLEIWKQVITNMLRSEDIELWKQCITEMRRSENFEMLDMLEVLLNSRDMTLAMLGETPENGFVLVQSCGDDVRHFKNVAGVLDSSEWKRRRSVLPQPTHVKFSSVSLSSESLTSLPPSSFYSTVSRLEIVKCTRLRLIPGLDGLPALETLVISECDKLEKLPDLGRSTALKHLSIRDFRKGPRFEFLSHLCQPLHAYPTTWMPCSNYKSLVELNFDSCVGLGGLEHWGPLPALESLVINNCNTITQLPNLENSPKLSKVIVMKCGRYREAVNLGFEGALRVVRIEGCGNEKLTNTSCRDELCLELENVLLREFAGGTSEELVDWLRRGESDSHHLDMFSRLNIGRFEFTGPTLEKFNLVMKQWALRLRS